MNEHQLRCFVASATYLNFTKAAASLYMSQASMTYQISELEKNLHTRLFQRRGRFIALTDEGKEFLLSAQKILDEMKTARERIKELSRNRHGLLRLGTYGDLLRPYLPGLLSTFRETHPEIEISLEQGTASTLIESLNTSKLDAIFLTDFGDLRNTVEGVEFTHLFDDDFLVALPSNHPLACRNLIYMEDLADEPLMVFSEKEFQDRETGAFTLNHIHYAHDSSSIPLLIQAGYYCCVYMNHVAPRNHPGITLVPLDYAPIEVYLCTMQSQNVNGLVSSFAHTCTSWLSKQR